MTDKPDKREPCPKCKGRKALLSDFNAMSYTCPACQGTGKKESSDD